MSVESRDVRLSDCGSSKSQDRGLRIAAPRSPLPAPRLPPRHHPHRGADRDGHPHARPVGRGGVFPVGSFYMQKAEIADQRLGDRPSGDERHRRPRDAQSEAWYVMVPNPTRHCSDTSNFRFRRDGKYAPTAPATKRGTFTRPFAEALLEALSQPTAATDPTLHWQAIRQCVRDRSDGRGGDGVAGRNR